MDITGRIGEIRRQKGITQKAIADQMGMDQGNYSKLEKRGEKMTVEQLLSIADALGVPLGEILGIEAKEGAGQQDRAKDLEKEVKALNDRLIDKEYRANDLERERILIEQLLFQSLSAGAGHSVKLPDYESFIVANPWIVALLSGLSFNSIKISDSTWKKYWQKAINNFVKNYFKRLNEGEPIKEYDLVLSESYFSVISSPPDNATTDEFLEWVNDPYNEVETIAFYSCLPMTDEQTS